MTSDGCTKWWNGFYNLLCDACRDHDLTYEQGARSGMTRLQTDNELLHHVWASSYSSKLSFWEKTIIRANAPLMFAGVRTLGATNYGPGRKWGYGDIY